LARAEIDTLGLTPCLVTGYYISIQLRRGIMRGRIAFLVVVLSALLLAACGGGGGGGTILPPPTGGGGGGGGGSTYPQHYTTDLDGWWTGSGSNVRFTDPEGLLTAADRAELGATFSGYASYEIRDGRLVIGTPPYGMQLTENRITKLSPSQYEQVERGQLTMPLSSGAMTTDFEWFRTGVLSSTGNQCSGSAFVSFWFSVSGETVFLGISYDFVASKTSGPG
jgi:hypothetical protein